MEWGFNEYDNCFVIWLNNHPVAYFSSIEEVREYINSYYKRNYYEVM